MNTKAIAINAFRFFVFIFVLFLPLKIHLFPGFNSTMGLISSSILSGLNALLGFNDLKYANKVFSDSSGMYLFAFYILFFSLLVAFVVQVKFKTAFTKWVLFFDTFAIYYLVFILLKYGFDKVFFNQFYPVNPALLYTEFGNLSKDIVFWSLAGSSKFYQFVSGAIELLAAVLILFISTRRLGLVLAVLIFVNVCLINFSFDISVKLFSLLMLSISIYASGKFMANLFRFLINKVETVPMPIKNNFLEKQKKWLKPLIIVLLLMETSFPFVLANGQSIGNSGQRMEAYKVRDVSIYFNFQELFLLENARLVVKTADGKMLSGKYTLSADNSNIMLHLPEVFSSPAVLNATAMVLKAHGRKGELYELKLEKLPWKNKALIMDEFHWTVDAMMQ